MIRESYFDKEGKPIDLQTWSNLFGDLSYRFVKKDHVGDYLISTIWLGLDHQFSPYSKAIVIFETMVFKGGSGDELDMDRYSTEMEALVGHKKMVQKYEDKNGNRSQVR